MRSLQVALIAFAAVASAQDDLMAAMEACGADQACLEAVGQQFADAIAEEMGIDDMEDMVEEGMEDMEDTVEDMAEHMEDGDHDHDHDGEDHEWDEEWEGGDFCEGDECQWEGSDMDQGAGGFDISSAIGELENFGIDASSCANVDPADPSACLDAIEAGVRSVDVKGAIMGLWEGVQEEDEFKAVAEVVDSIDAELGNQIDAVVYSMAEIAEDTRDNSPLIDADRWEAGINEVMNMMQSEEAPPDLSNVTAAAEDIMMMPDEFMEGLEENEDLASAMETIDGLLGLSGEQEGSAIAAIEGETAVVDAIEALLESEEPTEELIQAAADAIAASEVAQEEINKIVEAATAGADVVFAEVSETLDELLNEKIPALNSAIQEVAPPEIGSMVEDAWSTVGSVMTAVGNDEEVSAVRAQLNDQLTNVETIAGTEGLTALVEKTQDFGEAAQQNIQENSPVPDGGNTQDSDDDGADFANSMTASIAALIALAPVLAF